MTTSRLAKRLSSAIVLLAAGIILAACVSSPYGTTGTAGGSSSGQSLSDLVDSGLTIQAERGSETLDITRAQPGGKRPANIEQDSWTIFVYLCGSNLESQGAAATKDLNEILSAGGSDKIQFVVETGGAKTWRNNVVRPNKLGRYLIKNGQMSDLGSVSLAAMGEASTLADFLNWGIKNYPADHMGLILWDHGGGSITGVCFDERAKNDSLYLRELDSALASAYTQMWDKFEFIGFDACLMSTLETANILASYSNYMIASQESEPGNGWEYTSIVKYLAQNPSTTGKELGETICNSYLASLDRNTKGFATLSVVDLSKIDQLIQDYYRFSQEMYDSGADQSTLAAMSRGINKVSNYGCNNRREGYTNMVDLGGLVDACASVTPSAADVQQSLHDAVTYQIRGTYHADATGLSTYYPLRVNTSQELAIFQTVAVNPSYLQYVDRLAHGATYNGGSQYQQYTGDTFYENNIWNWLLGNTTEQQEVAEDHWEYVDDHSESSTQITFANEPQVDNEGTFWFQFDQHGIDNAAVVSGIVYQLSDDGADLVSLGETYDVYGDWETGEFSDGFDGYWLSLPDGQNLNLSVESATDDYFVYTSPITLNGRECYLRMRQNISDGTVEVEGAWNGVSENGAVDRGVTALKRGDVIVPQYKAFSTDSNANISEYEGNPYTVTSKGLTVSYDILPEGTYLYSFCIQDVFGDSYFTNGARFEIDADGTIYFE